MLSTAYYAPSFIVISSIFTRAALIGIVDSVAGFVDRQLGNPGHAR
jgi:hypothetical protein